MNEPCANCFVMNFADDKEKDSYYWLAYSLWKSTAILSNEKISVPEIGRYQLDCEIDDCIVCDKCAKVCPVDCIKLITEETKKKIF